MKRGGEMKRTEFKRTAPMSRTAKPASGKPKPKTCRTCKTKFEPAKPMQIACGLICAQAYGAKVTAAQKLKKERADRAAVKKALEKFKKRPKYVAEAQAAFNAFIRFRDRDLPCICCGSFDAGGEGLPGGGWDAGHWISRGHASHLRFDERNVHKQRKGCNKPGGTTRAKYRIGLAARIGEQAVQELEALEYTPPTRDLTKEELVAIKEKYQSKLRELKGTKT